MTHANRPGLLPKTSRLLAGQAQLLARLREGRSGACLSPAGNGTAAVRRGVPQTAGFDLARLPVLAALPLFILAMGTEVVAQEVASAPTLGAEDVCQSSVETEQRQCAAQLSAAIRVARARADAKMLDAQAQSLEDLVQRVQEQEAQQGNKGLTDRVCDVDCTIERASVRLFRANDFPILGTKPSSESAVDGDLLAQIMDGLRFVEHGLLTLPRRKGSYNPDASTEAGFKHYLEGLAALSALKVRLLMAGGDLWYRAASASAVRTVGYAVGEATGTAPSSGGELELQKAQAFYEEGFWAVVEAETGVPSSGYGDVLLDLRNLRADLSRRLDSVQRGYLFLNVDPDQQTRWTLLQVGEQLRTQASALEVVNDDIESNVKEWAARKDEYNQRGIDLERYASSKAIEAEVYRLAELQNVAQGRQSALEREIDSIANGLATVDEQLRADQILAALERERLELKYELGTIDKQTTQDLLALNKETIEGQLEAVGARIEKTLADYNFEMQLQELTQRKISLETDLQTLNLELAQVGTQQTQVTARKAIENERIAIADTNIRQLTETQGKVFELHRQAMQQEIAGIDEELSYLDRSASSLDKVCQQRANNKSLEGQELEKVKACIQSGCEGGTGLKAAYDALFEKNTNLLTEKGKALAKTKESLNNGIQRIGDAARNVGDQISNLEFWDAAIAVAAEVKAASEAALQASTAFITELPVAIDLGFVDAAAGVALAVAQNQVTSAERNLDKTRFNYETDNAKRELQISLDQAAADIGSIDVQKEVEDWSHRKFLTEVGVDLARTQTQIVLAENDKTLGELECNGDKLDLERTKAKQTSAKQVLVAQMAAKQAENALLTYDLEEQRHLQDQSRLEIARLSAESAGLDIEKQQTQARINSTNTLLEAVAQQRSRVEGYRAQVNDLTASQQSLQAARDELNERVKQGIIALADDHKQFVTAALESAEKAAKQQLSRIAEKITALSRQQKVTDALAALEQELVQAVSASNSKIQGLIEKDQIQIEAGQAKMVATFWDYEGMLSKMTRGMPEVLARKRGLLENVNFWYNLYRNRYRLLSGFASDISAGSTGPVFLTDPDQVRNELGNYCVDVGPNELCRPNSLALSGASIAGQRALFTLDRFDSLAVQLADEGTARFEISPSGATTQGEAGNRSRVLWQKNMDPERPLVLLDAAVFADGCVSRDASYAIRLKHLGFGTQVRPYGGTTLVEFVSRNAVANADLVLLPNTDTASAASTFDEKSVQLSQVEYLLRDIHDAGFPFFGYPMVAQYELQVGPELQLCLSQNRPQLIIKMVFAN